MVSCLFLQPTTFSADSWTDIKSRTTADLEKPWTITFSKEVSEASITNNNLYVEDVNGKGIPITWEVDKKEVTVLPVTPYANHATYQLKILSTVKSKDDKELAGNVRFEFRTQAQSVNEIPYAKSVEVKNSTSKLSAFKIETPVDYVSYDLNGAVAYSEIQTYDRVFVPANGTAVVSFNEVPENDLSIGKEFVVAPTTEQAFLKVKQPKGTTVSWTATTQNENPVVKMQGGTFDYVQYNRIGIDEFGYKENLKTLVASKEGKIMITASSDEDTIAYGAQRKMTYAIQQKPSLAITTVQPRMSISLQNIAADNEMSSAKLVSRGMYDYTMYPYPTANQHNYMESSFYDQQPISIKEKGDTVLTNRDTKPMTVFAPAENVEIVSSNEPAYREVSLKPGENVHAMYEVSEATKDSVLLTVRGEGYIDYTLYKAERTDHLFRNFQIDGEKTISSVFGNNFKGTMISNKGDTELLIYMPYRFSVLEKTDVPAVMEIELMPGEETNIRSDETAGIVYVEGNNATYQFYKFLHKSEEAFSKTKGEVVLGKMDSTDIPVGGHILVKNESLNGETLTVYASSLANQFYSSPERQ